MGTKKLELGPLENVKLSLDAATKDLLDMRERASERKLAIEQIKEVAVENKKLEQHIAAAKKTMFLLLHERFRSGINKHSAEYAALVERDAKALESTPTEKK